MNYADKPPLLIRVLGAVFGSFCGAVSGAILLLATIVIARSTLGLNNVWPGSLVGALVGSLLGFFFPRVLKVFITIFVYFP
jgi:hypothetical protein